MDTGAKRVPKMPPISCIFGMGGGSRNPPAGTLCGLPPSLTLERMSVSKGSVFGTEMLFVASLLLWLQVAWIVMAVASPDDLKMFASVASFERIFDTSRILFYPVVVTAFFRLVTSDEPQEEWCCAWATALLINMVIGAAGALAGDNDVGFGNIVTGVWACAFCIAAMTILKLVHAMCVVAFRILSPGKLAVIASIATILMVFVAGSKLASNSDEKAFCVISCVHTISLTCGLGFISWLWGKLKSLKLDGEAVQTIAATSVIGMVTLAAYVLASNQDEREVAIMHGVYSFGVSTVLGFVFGISKMMRRMSKRSVGATMAVLSSLVLTNMMFAAVLCIASTKEEKVTALTAYVWTMILLTCASAVVWLISQLPALLADPGRLTAFSTVALIDMVLGAAGVLAGSKMERMACIWFGVITLAAFTLLTLSSGVFNLIELSLKDPELSTDIKNTSQSTAQALRRASDVSQSLAGLLFSPSASPATFAFSRSSSLQSAVSPLASPKLSAKTLRHSDSAQVTHTRPLETAIEHGGLKQKEESGSSDIFEAFSRHIPSLSPLINSMKAPDAQLLKEVDVGAGAGRPRRESWGLLETALRHGGVLEEEASAVGEGEGMVFEGGNESKVGRAKSPLSFDTWSQLTGDVGGELSPPPEEEDVKETPPPAPAQSASAARAVADALGEWQEVSGGKWKVKL